MSNTIYAWARGHSVILLLTTAIFFHSNTVIGALVSLQYTIRISFCGKRLVLDNYLMLAGEKNAFYFSIRKLAA